MEKVAMIVGIGVDMTEVARIEKAGTRERFLRRCYTEKEIELCRGKPQKLAGNFAVKEAVSKSFGTGFSSFYPDEIEVLRDEAGKPYVNLYGKAKGTADSMSINKIHVSITNVKEYAVAYVVAEKMEV